MRILSLFTKSKIQIWLVCELYDSSKNVGGSLRA